MRMNHEYVAKNGLSTSMSRTRAAPSAQLERDLEDQRTVRQPNSSIIEDGARAPWPAERRHGRDEVDIQGCVVEEQPRLGEGVS